MYYINTMKDKNRVTISVDIENTFDNFQHTSMIKVQQNRIRKELSKVIKGTHKTPQVNIIVNAERQNALAEDQQETRQRYLILILLFSIVMEVLVRAIKQEKILKYINTGKEEVKLSI